MTSIRVGERNERRRNEIAHQIIRDYSPIRFGSGMWRRLVALIGISASDIDYSEADEGMHWSDLKN
jgi:hypothetical protein